MVVLLMTGSVRGEPSLRPVRSTSLEDEPCRSSSNGRGGHSSIVVRLQPESKDICKGKEKKFDFGYFARSQN